MTQRAGALPPTDPAITARLDRFERWLANVSRPQPAGHGAVFTPARPLTWTPLGRPLNACRVTLVTTAGVHPRSQPPFAVQAGQGDWTWRAVRGDVDAADLTVTHTHYDTSDAMRDVNVVFPVDRLRELLGEGLIGSVADTHYGFMGFIPDPLRLVRETAPAVARALVAEHVDVAVLTAG